MLNILLVHESRYYHTTDNLARAIRLLVVKLNLSCGEKTNPDGIEYIPIEIGSVVYNYRIV